MAKSDFLNLLYLLAIGFFLSSAELHNFDVIVQGSYRKGRQLVNDGCAVVV